MNSKQLPWPCDPSLPSIRYDDEFRSQAFSLQLVYREGASSIPTAVVYTGWRTALQVLLSAHLAPSSTYPTHQATQSCQSQDTLLTSQWPEKDGATTAGSRRRRPSSWSWKPSSRNWRPSSWSGDQFQGAGDQVQGAVDQSIGAGHQAQGAGQPVKGAAHLGLEAGLPAEVVRQKALGFRQLKQKNLTPGG